ncbi:MAG: DNA translocase FtsK [Chromatiaceae bacterium]|nr:MAG: DNA translocase FtsK [Chromatiaceae bacterium]
MSQATRAGQLTFTDYLDRAWREAALWALVALALYLVVALATWSPEDPGWSYTGSDTLVRNAAGPFGAWFADLTLFLFGLFAYLLPLTVAWSAYLVFRQRVPEPETKLYWLVLRWIGFLFILVAGSALASMQFPEFAPALAPTLPNGVGGGLGLLAGEQAAATFGATGGSLFLGGLILAGFTLFTGLSPVAMVDALGGLTLSLLRLPFRALWLVLGAVGGVCVASLDWVRTPWFRTPPDRHHSVGDAGHGSDSASQLDGDDWVDPRSLLDQERYPYPLPEAYADPDFDPASTPMRPDGAAPDRDADRITRQSDLAPAALPAPAAAEPTPAAPPRPAAAPALAGSGLLQRPPATAVPAAATARPHPPRPDVRPPLELLDAPRRSGRAISHEQLEGMSRDLEARLAEFGVVAQVVEVHPGPVVALFELELAPGVKVSKITGLAKDLARALSKVSVRVVEVIPGKSVIGLEVPNDTREMVVLREILAAPVYQEAKSPLTIGMGTNISGEPVVADLGRMPHALIAGTTGSGKSVAINAVILSLVYKASAADVRLIMVDPKMLELSVYEGIPHLLTPVVTDMKEAANALRWCVGEMERRYKLMARLGVRNIAGYNRKVLDAIAAGEPIADPLFNPAEAIDPQQAPPTLEKLPYIVVVIDELADMMMVVGKKVEELIARLAQKARASGIHLLLATQRPSVDVLTGLIKANIPTRIAFKVSARVDSRTVLDQMGAEHLLGHGDMLYLPPGGSIPQRVHGAFVDDHEVHRVVNFLKEQGPPDYINTILQEPGEHLPGIDPEPRGGGDTEGTDPLFDEAVQIVCESRRASISGVQRRLKIGYNRAARMIEEMERIGIVGPAETNGNREVLAPPPVAD